MPVYIARCAVTSQFQEFKFYLDPIKGTVNIVKRPNLLIVGSTHLCAKTYQTTRSTYLRCPPFSNVIGLSNAVIELYMAEMHITEYTIINKVGTVIDGRATNGSRC